MAGRRKDKSSPAQGELDFGEYSLNARRRMLKELTLPTVWLSKKVCVSGAMMIAVLKEIDDYGRGRSCWPGIDTLARGMKRGEATVRRCCEAIEHLGLMARQRKKCPPDPDGQVRVRLHFVIFWDEVKHRAKHGYQAVTLTAYQPVNAPDQPVNAPDQPVNAPPRSLYVKREGSEKEPPPPPPPEKSQTSASGDQAAGDPSRCDWAAAADVLFRCDVATVSKAIRKARANRLTPADVIALAAVYQRDQARYQGPGALVWAIGNYRPGQAADDDRFWPVRPAEQLPF